MNSTITFIDTMLEEEVIGTLLIRPIEYLNNADILSDGLFTEYKAREIFKAIKSIFDRGNLNNDLSNGMLVEAIQELEKSKSGVTPEDVAAMANKSAPGILRPNINHLLDLQHRREGQAICDKARRGFEDISKPIEETQQEAMDQMKGLLDTAASSIQSMKAVGDEFTQDIINGNREGKRDNNILHTGYKVLDDMGCLQLSDLCVIAAESSQGKSTLALNISKSVAGCGVPVGYYSMEMTATQLFARMMAPYMGMSSNELTTRPLAESELERYTEVSKQVKSLPIYFDERSTSTIDNVLASIRTMVYRKGIKLAVVDYLQILNVNSQRSLNQEQEIGEAARRFKNLAKELNICVVVLSQLSRNKDNSLPTIARLRGSGQIAEAADVVLLIYRPQYYEDRGMGQCGYPDQFKGVSIHGTAMIDVAKGRNIGTTSFIAGFNGQLSSFYDIDPKELPQRGMEERPVDDEDPF